MSTNNDVESTHHEQLPQSELDPLIQRDEKGPTKKEARMARAQFLTLCWALFVIGWTDGSTGPLLPRIQSVYDVSCHLFIFQYLINSADRVRNRVLGICVAMHGQWSLLSPGGDYLTPFLGSSCGSIAQYAIERQTGLRKRKLLDFHNNQVNVISLDARGRTSFPDCSVSCPIS